MAIIQSVWALPLLALAILENIVPTEGSFDSSTVDEQELLRVLLIVIGLAAASALLSLTIQLAMLHVLVQRATGQPVSVGAALIGGLRRVPAMLGWGILQGLLILVGLVLCVLPGIYVLIALLILPAVVLLERGKGIGRAFELFHADFGASIARIGTIVGLAVAFGVIESSFSTVIGGGGFLTSATMSTPAAVAVGVVSVIVSIASSLVVTPLLLTAYADMRARREPFSTAYLTPEPFTPGQR
jgi:hypothetical protein